jgi:8-oxo-dGTP pyrophosphatase MutT (NUDIX family)
VKPLVRAAGGVVTRPASGRGPEILVVHRPKYDDWSLPKGKLERDEREEDAAVREVAEETGYQCRLLEELGVRRYEDRRGRPKQVRYWHMQPISDEGFTPSVEVDEIRWLPVSEAVTLLSYEGDRRLIEAWERLVDDLSRSPREGG